MYIIVSDKIFDDGLAYLIWQPGCWYDGWTWTRKECVRNCLSYNRRPHGFVFNRIEDAWRTIRNLNLRTGYVIKLPEGL